MGNFMEKRLVGEGSNRTNRDLPTSPGVSLGIAVQRLEFFAFDLQRYQRDLFAPLGKARWFVIFALRLGQGEPEGPQGEMCECELFLLLTPVFPFNRFGAFTSQRHAQSQGLLALLHVPT